MIRHGCHELTTILGTIHRDDVLLPVLARPGSPSAGSRHQSPQSRERQRLDAVGERPPGKARQFREARALERIVQAPGDREGKTPAV